MNNYWLPVDWEALEKVIVTVLKEDLDNLRKEWETVYQGTEGMVFHMDRKEDLDEISDHIQAYKKVIRYYGGTP
jgi:hypothetical protein